MIFLITHDGRTRAGLELLGVHRLGVRLWWIAILGTFSISLLATAITWATPFASFAPPDRPLDTVLNFVVNAIVTILTFAAIEELAWRGYLLPRLLQFGRNRALAITGLVHAGWHLPLILLTPLYHPDGNLLIILPLFVGTIVAAGFVYGDLRLATGSIWPASIAHGVHNAAWGALSALTVTTSPVLVNEYLAGDTGVLILLATILAAVLLRRWLRRSSRTCTCQEPVMKRRRLLIVLLVLAALPLLGAGWQRLATLRDQRRYPPPGELVAVDERGTRLHLHTQARQHRENNPHSPVVVLDSGTPGFSAQWGWIQPAIAEFATVVSYDRPGLGWSDPRRDDASQDPRDTAHRLHAALQKLGLPGPYVVVGHSYGGLTSRVFAAAYPDEVNGLVLVDPSHPNQGGRPGSEEQPGGSMSIMVALAHIGALRLGLSTGLFDSRIGDLPERQGDEAGAIFVQPGQWSTVQLELAAWSDIASQLEPAKPLGELPLTVLTAGTTSVDGTHQLHAEIAALSSRGRHLSVAEATHLSLLTDREHSRATVDAVRAILTAT